MNHGIEQDSVMIHMSLFLQNSSKGIDSLPEDVIHALSRNKKARKLIAEMYPDSMIAQSLSNCCLGDEGNKADRTGDANASDVKGTGISADVTIFL